MRGALVLVFASLLLGTACGRTEQPHGAPSASPPRYAAAEPKPTAKPHAMKRPACMRPTPEQGPPPARPARSCPKDPLASPPELPHGYVTFMGAPGSPRVAVELARTPGSRERGLMYRTHMPDDRGMLFSWNNDKVRTFWMHNTCIPLDMLFVTRDGTIAGILEQVPTLNDDARSVPCPVAYVLELNAGWARSHGVKAGQQVEIEP